MNKRTLAIIVISLFIISTVGFAFFLRSQPVDSAPSDIVKPTESTESGVDSPTITRSVQGMHDGEAYFENILSGGVPKDGIPPIEDPTYMSMEEADPWLTDVDRVFVLESSDGVFVYPQRVLVWHEIVNETVDGETLSITYCPLTGSCVGYYGPEGTSFGTSGRLLNSNLVMYDRETDKYWSQIMGQVVEADGVGQTLLVKPIHWTIWRNVKNTYEDVKVLSDETGFFRDYDRDPYGSYVDDDSYYYNTRVMFPTMAEDDRLPPKKVVVGVKGPEGVLAIDPTFVMENGPVYTEVGGQAIVAFYDKSLEAVRVFKREATEQPTSYESLETADHFDVMWFAWAAFYPETEILE